MTKKRLLACMIVAMATLAIFASSAGIFSNNGNGNYQYTTIRGKPVTIHGKGIYRHMSAEVAPQGIAQDHVTLFIAVPFLLFSLILSNRNSVRGKLFLTGTVGYFLVTYLFYLVMAMYNELFLVYVALTALAFYSFLLLVTSFRTRDAARLFSARTPVKWIGSFLIFISLSIAVLWLSIVLPPLSDGSIIPVQAEHFTTLIVQGLDLAILLPAAFIVGMLLYRKQAAGFCWGTVYIVFLSILMTALTAKVIALAHLGYPVIPVIFIIPTFNLVSIVCTAVLLRNIRTDSFRLTNQGRHVNSVLTK